jgi:hypothetical protein
MDFLKDHLLPLITVSAVLPLVIKYGLPLLASHLSEIRKRQIARGVNVAFYAVENLKAEFKDQNKEFSGFEKTAEFVRQLDAYMASNGWRPLTDAEKALAKQQADAIHGQIKASNEVPEASPLAKAPAA